MRNIKATVKKNTLHLEIDLSTVVDTSGAGNDIICGTNNWEQIELPADHELSRFRYSFRGVMVRKEAKAKNQNASK
jgi:hypothetical protein